uniref:RF_PROK_I domain-containing protein n=1 Tax=Rhabditophanes sp. KR3021 TaxID=114890 RepID=A0AC35TZN9_9BILA
MQVINGWGPGGSRVNAIKNAVFLRHKETGLHVKVHESRLLPDNIDIAFERLKHVLDRHLNGDACYDEQLKELERIREDRNKSKRLKSRLLKANLGSEIPIIEKN